MSVNGRKAFQKYDRFGRRRGVCLGQRDYSSKGAVQMPLFGECLCVKVCEGEASPCFVRRGLYYRSGAKV